MPRKPIKTPENQLIMPRNPTKQSENQLIMPTPIKTQEEGEIIEITDIGSAWGAWSAGIYEPFQPFAEIVDNAIAALTSDPKKADGSIYINFNFENNIGNIEHSGGITFPHNVDGLQRCLTYGRKQQSNLNEHGCGLKTSLAILDPNNNMWEIWIKVIIEGTLTYFQIKAPYSNKMLITKRPDWPGINKTRESGSFIKFPINKSHFKQLYSSTKDPKMSDLKDLHNRIKCHFSHLWMKLDQYINGDIRILYNEEKVTPFSFISPGIYEDFVETTNKKEFNLSTKAVVKVDEIKLNKDARKIPGSYKFKYAMDANGAYLFKNGRLIEVITTGEQYKRIFGGVPDPHHNGTIILVNMIGDQVQLPATVPTKNKFGVNDLFNELIDTLSTIITRFQKREHESEEIDVVAYKKRRENMLKTLSDPFTLEQEKRFRVSDSILTPPIDLVEQRGKEIVIMEFKTSTTLEANHISQTLLNWILVSKSQNIFGYNLQPVIVLRAMDDNKGVVSYTNKEYLQILKEMCGFNPIIRNTKDEILYPI